MPHLPTTLRSLLPHHPWLISIPLVMAVMAHAADDRQQITDQMRSDCRAEGEAGGLEGAELDTYIRDCINDLLTVEISNIEE